MDVLFLGFGFLYDPLVYVARTSNKLVSGRSGSQHPGCGWIFGGLADL